MEAFDIAIHSSVSFSDVDARPVTLALIAAIAKSAIPALDDYFAQIIATNQAKYGADMSYLAAQERQAIPAALLGDDVCDYPAPYFPYEG